MITKNLLFSKTSLPAVQKSMDAAMLRNRAIAHNISNINTPGYKRIEVSFEDDLKRALDKSKVRGKKTNKMHMDMGKPRINKVRPKSWLPEDPTLASSENNVDIDIENAKLAENQILFNFGVKFAGERFGAINESITGRRKP